MNDPNATDDYDSPAYLRARLRRTCPKLDEHHVINIVRWEYEANQRHPRTRGRKRVGTTRKDYKRG